MASRALVAAAVSAFCAVAFFSAAAFFSTASVPAAIAAAYTAAAPPPPAPPLKSEAQPLALRTEQAPANFVLGTQGIYAPDWDRYNFTADDILTEQVRGIARMGGNQFKMRLSPKTTCTGYGLHCGDDVKTLKDLAQVPEVADAFAFAGFKWYQLWLYSFSHPYFLKYNWTEETLDAEYNETKAWAIHMLETYSGTGKVFMAGNWEGDWMLMGASGCFVDGKANMTCDPTPEVLNRAVQWGQCRQRAIDDARKEAKAENVWLYYYMEINLGVKALGGKPGMTNNVLPLVNPDFVSYSSYDVTNAFQTNTDVAHAEQVFSDVLDYVKSKLPEKQTAALSEMGFQQRVFIGEFGANPKSSPTDFEVNRFLTRVMSAALRWGVPFVLYWEFYSTYDTVPIVPPTGPKSGLQRLFEKYYAAASSFVESYGSTPPPAVFAKWAAGYFKVPSKGKCKFQANTGYNSAGYSFAASSEQECCDLCAADPTCAVGVFVSGKCYMKFEATAKGTGSGVACVKQPSSDESAPIFVI